MEQNDEVFYEKKEDKETYKFYLDKEIGEVEIHCVYKNGERDSISIPVDVLKCFMDEINSWEPLYRGKFDKGILKLYYSQILNALVIKYCTRDYKKYKLLPIWLIMGFLLNYDVVKKYLRSLLELEKEI